MTSREEDILKIISEDPMISQNKLAERLNLTRSSVSVYITNMMRSGILKGRGYIIADEDYPIIIGSVALDINAVFDEPLTEVLDSQAPQKNCKISFSYSGGAKNLAENLARLEMQPKIISAIAYDLYGNDIIRDCNQHGISTELCLFLENATTNIYLDINGPTMSLAGLADNIIDLNITPEFLETKYIYLKKANQIVIEDRLPTETIDYLTSTFQSSQLCLMTSRRFSYIDNYLDFLDRFSVIQFSFQVASHLCEMDNSSYKGKIVPDSIIRKMANVLLTKTKEVKHILFPTYGNKLCYVCHSNIYVITLHDEISFLDDFKLTRDALLAGMMYCLNHNYSDTETLLFLAACNEISGRCPTAVNRNLCLQLVLSTIQGLREISPIRKL